MFNKKLAHDFLIYITKNQLPDDFSEYETRNITLPLVNILANENKDSCSISGNSLLIQGTSYLIIPAFKKSGLKTITDFEILEELPSLVEKNYKCIGDRYEKKFYFAHYLIFDFINILW